MAKRYLIENNFQYFQMSLSILHCTEEKEKIILLVIFYNVLYI